MREASRTTRQRIADRLRDEPVAAGALANEFSVRTDDALDHVDHIARSLEPTEETLLVAPPECEDCGFDGFDDLVNRPARCPECKSEAVTEPAFTID
ncbi:transcriptional regulator [Halobacteriales archaeon QS_4_69_31]|jgi:predicted Zn-ribbon and HTH transcriptional regulator|nr:MAG: transcriptional regulator [Halobacteriales archaeon QS_4_69_31]